MNYQQPIDPLADSLTAVHYRNRYLTHEQNNLLHLCRGYLNCLRTTVSEDEQASSDLDSALHAIQRIAALTEAQGRASVLPKESFSIGFSDYLEARIPYWAKALEARLLCAHRSGGTADQATVQAGISQLDALFLPLIRSADQESQGHGSIHLEIDYLAATDDSELFDSRLGLEPQATTIRCRLSVKKTNPGSDGIIPNQLTSEEATPQPPDHSQLEHTPTISVAHQPDDLDIGQAAYAASSLGGSLEITRGGAYRLSYLVTLPTQQSVTQDDPLLMEGVR